MHFFITIASLQSSVHIISYFIRIYVLILSVPLNFVLRTSVLLEMYFL